MELFNGRKRFSDLLEIDPTLTSKVLSERLRELFTHNIIEKIVINMMPLKFKYQLTEQGWYLKKTFFECALYSCLYYPSSVFETPPLSDKELIDELSKMFQIEKD